MLVRDPSAPCTVWTVVNRVDGSDWIVCQATIRRRNRKGTGFRNVLCQTMLSLSAVDIVADVETVEIVVYNCAAID